MVLAVASLLFVSLWWWSLPGDGCILPSDSTTKTNNGEQGPTISSSSSDGFVTYPAFWPLPGKEKANFSHFWSFEESVCWDKLDEKWIMFIGDSVFRNTLRAMVDNALSKGYKVDEWRAKEAEVEPGANDWTAVFHDKASTKKFYFTFKFVRDDAERKLPKYFADFHEEETFNNESKERVFNVFNKKVRDEILKGRHRPDVIFGNLGMWYLGRQQLFEDAVRLFFELGSKFGGKFIWRTPNGLGITPGTKQKMYRNSSVLGQKHFALELNKKYKFDVMDGFVISFTNSLSSEQRNDKHPDRFTMQEYAECVMDILCGRTDIQVFP